jgi:hypothetical protein
MDIVYSLVILMHLLDGTSASERYPVTTQECQTVNGVRTEDSSCGIRACMKRGRERAAVLWGLNPGATFEIMCFKDDGLIAKEGSNAGGGHPALNFEDEGGKKEGE